VKKGGPIARADYTIINETSVAQVEDDARKVPARIK